MSIALMLSLSVLVQVPTIPRCATIDIMHKLLADKFNEAEFIRLSGSFGMDAAVYLNATTQTWTILFENITTQIACVQASGTGIEGVKLAPKETPISYSGN